MYEEVWGQTPELGGQNGQPLLKDTGHRATPAGMKEGDGPSGWIHHENGDTIGPCHSEKKTLRIRDVAADARDAKTALQEWAQARGEVPPQYVEVARTGPDHQPVFTIEVRLASGPTEQATAGSKRHAEQAAATALLEKVDK